MLLVAVDDSEGSDKAFDFAVRHLHKPGMELHLVGAPGSRSCARPGHAHVGH